MNPTIIIESDAQDVSGPPRELLCSVWPVSQDGKDLVIGEPIFSNHMVLVGALESSGLRSTLPLPEAGAYLVDVGYPNGQSLRKTISVAEDQPYRLVVDAPRLVPAMSARAETRYSWMERVVSSAPRSTPAKGTDLEVSLVSQADPISLSGLYGFLNGIGRPGSRRANIFEQSVGTELTHEVMLAAPLREDIGPFEALLERKWLIVGGRGKAQTLLAYPYGWRCDSSVPFKLLLARKSNVATDSCKWTASLNLMDPVYGSMVAHLTRRDLFSTRIISESERGRVASALYKKAGNPFSAAAAAYIFALGGTEEPHHRSWMQNLSSKYAWLPDGAIALGWKTLYDGENNPHAWARARELILLACSRGLPYYTVGLHILVDALTLLSRMDPEDQAILSNLAAAKAADVVCVRTEPFTTLQISRYLGMPRQCT